MTLRVLQTSTEKKDPAETKTKKHTEIEKQEMGKVSKKIQCQFEWHLKELKGKKEKPNGTTIAKSTNRIQDEREKKSGNFSFKWIMNVPLEIGRNESRSTLTNNKKKIFTKC